MDIGYIFDDGYTQCTAVSIYSLMSNNIEAEEINIYVFDVGISIENKNYIKSIVDSFDRKIRFIDVKEIETQLKNMQVEPWRGSYTAYIKLFVCKYLPKEIRRFVVIDGDTVIDGSLKELFEMNLDEAICAMGLEGIYSGYKKYCGIGDGYHYNTGVIVYDVHRWLDENIEDKLINHLSKVFCSYMLPEEDLISIILPRDVKILNPKYNYLVQFEIFCTNKYFKRFKWNKDKFFYKIDDLRKAKGDVKIYHCIDTFTNRPWDKNNCHPFTKIYNSYSINMKKNIKLKKKLGCIEHLEYVLRKKLPYKMSVYLYYIAARIVYGIKAKIYYRG